MKKFYFLIVLLSFFTLVDSYAQSTDKENDCSSSESLDKRMSYALDSIRELSKEREEVLLGIVECADKVNDIEYLLVAKSFLYKYYFGIKDRYNYKKIQKELLAVIDTIDDVNPMFVNRLYYDFAINAKSIVDYDGVIKFGELYLKTTETLKEKKLVEINYHLTFAYYQLRQEYKLSQQLKRLKTLSTKDFSEDVLAIMIGITELYLSDYQLNYERSVLYASNVIDKDNVINILEIEDKAQLLVSTANGLSKLKRSKEAIALMNEAIDMANNFKFRNELIIASYKGNLAFVLNQMGRIEEAVEQYENVIEIMNLEKGEEATLFVLHYNLADCYYNLKKLKKANYYLDKCKSFDSNNIYVRLLETYILTNQKQYEKGLEKIQSVIVDLIPTFNDYDINTNPSLNDKAIDVECYRVALLTKALMFSGKGLETKNQTLHLKSLEVLDLVNDMLDKSYNTLSSYSESKLQGAEEILISLNIEYVSRLALYESGDKEQLTKIFDALEQRKAIVLIQSLNIPPLPKKEEEKQKEILNEIVKLEQQISFEKNEKVRNKLKAKLFKLKIQLEKFHSKMSKAYPHRAFSIFNNQGVSFADIQQSIGEDEAIIEYFVNSENVDVVLITHEDVQFKEFENKKELEAEVKKITSLLSNQMLGQNKNRKAFLNTAHSLYQKLIAPFEKEIKNKKKLTIVPEAFLFHLPFEALVRNENDVPFEDMDYLIKDKEISYRYSLSAHHFIQKRKPILNNSLVAFAPVFEKGNTIGNGSITNYRSESFGEEGTIMALPNTRREVEEIAKIVKGDKEILLEEDANKSNFKSVSEKEAHQFVHIASHGVVDFENHKLSGIICFNQNEEINKNMIFANEIKNLNLKADLVVLSSCESGVGLLVKGEGMMALNRSFVMAGARNVIFSLWKINDKYSADFMIDFYKEYYKTESYNSALRAAKINMLSNPETAQPRFWAPFLLIGE